jgi:transposase
VVKKLDCELGIKVSRGTVTNALKNNGLKSHEKQTKPMLSKKNVADRLSFANTHKDWTVEDWKNVIWSDETKINRFCSDGRSWYWSHDGSSLQPSQVKQTVKHGGGSIMIWGCMTTKGPGFMCKIDGKMEQTLYKQILSEELARTIEHYSIDARDVIFQHDNSPIHKAKSVVEYLKNQEYQVLQWPAQSPDLNPIEHLWSKLKRELNKYEQPPNGMLELWKRIEYVWDEKITQNDCQILIESMPRRIEAVIKAKGWWTKY